MKITPLKDIDKARQFLEAFGFQEVARVGEILSIAL